MVSQMLCFNGGTAAQPHRRGRSRINEGGQEGGGQHICDRGLGLYISTYISIKSVSANFDGTYFKKTPLLWFTWTFNGFNLPVNGNKIMGNWEMVERGLQYLRRGTLTGESQFYWGERFTKILDNDFEQMPTIVPISVYRAHYWFWEGI